MSQPAFGPNTAAVQQLLTAAAALDDEQISALAAAARRANPLAAQVSLGHAFRVARRAKQQAAVERASAAAYHAITRGGGGSADEKLAGDAASHAAIAACLGTLLPAAHAERLAGPFRTVSGD